jgi:N-glycosylase/DNA lyase
VANHFRKLWGREAGWAHSVLFTADLKAFSERLVAKTEVKEETTEVKIEPNGEPIIEDVNKTKTAAKKKVKRALEEEHQIVKVEETTATRRSKRKRT